MSLECVMYMSLDLVHFMLPLITLHPPQTLHVCVYIYIYIYIYIRTLCCLSPPLQDNSSMLIEASRGGHTAVASLILRQPRSTAQRQPSLSTSKDGESRKGGSRKATHYRQPVSAQDMTRRVMLVWGLQKPDLCKAGHTSLLKVAYFSQWQGNIMHSLNQLTRTELQAN